MWKGWESWGCSAWRRKGSRKTLLWFLSVKKGLVKKMGTNLLATPAEIRQVVMSFKVKEGWFRLDIKKKVFTLRGVKTGICFPEW